MKNEEIVKELPVARFYYQGSHSHPVRRTVLVKESTKKYLKGYELREGATIRNLTNAPVKCYRRDKIAKVEQCGKRLRKRTPTTQLRSSTLQRANLLDLLRNGS